MKTLYALVKAGRPPDAEQAWHYMPKSEDTTGFVTADMLQAWQAAEFVYLAGDERAEGIFKSYYALLAKDAPCVWILSMGYDVQSRYAYCDAAQSAGCFPLRPSQSATRIVQAESSSAVNEQWMIISGYDGVELSGPYPDEATAQEDIDNNPSLAGGVTHRLDNFPSPT